MHRSPPEGLRLSRRRAVLGQLARPRTWTLVAALACTGVAMLPTGTRADLTPAAKADPAPSARASRSRPPTSRSSSSRSRSPSATPAPSPAPSRPLRPTRIRVTDPMYCQSMIGTGPDQIAEPAAVLRAPDRRRLLQQPGARPGEDRRRGPGVPAPDDAGVPGTPEPSPPLLRPARGLDVLRAERRATSSTPSRASISNLIVDQTSTNPAAIAAAGFPVRTQGNPGVVPCVTEPTTPAGAGSRRLHPVARDAVHPERDDRRRPLAAVQLAVHAVRPVLRPRRRPDRQGRTARSSSR